MQTIRATWLTAKKLAELANEFKKMGNNPRFECLVNGKTVILSDVRPTPTPKGYPGRRFVSLLEDGKRAEYAANCDFAVVALLVRSERYFLPGEGSALAFKSLIIR